MILADLFATRIREAKKIHKDPDPQHYSKSFDMSYLPPVPSPLVKSPPWSMKSLMTLWKEDPM